MKKTFMRTFCDTYSRAYTRYNDFVSNHPNVVPLFMSTTSHIVGGIPRFAITVIFEGDDPTEVKYNEVSELEQSREIH